MAMVRLPAMNPAQKLNFFLFTSAEGKGAPLPFWGPSQSFGISLFLLPMSGDLRSLSTNTWSPLRDPHSFLTVTCLTAWYCQFKYGRIVLVLPLRLRGLSRDTWLTKGVSRCGLGVLMKFWAELSLMDWSAAANHAAKETSQLQKKLVCCKSGCLRRLVVPMKSYYPGKSF